MSEKSKREGAKSLIKEITPHHLRCAYGACPGVYTLESGNLLIVGKRLSADLAAQIRDRVGEDEYAVELSPEFFNGIANAS
jgi:hypothetical protein